MNAIPKSVDIQPRRLGLGKTPTSVLDKQSDGEALVMLENAFIAIAPRSTQSRSDSIWNGQIELFAI